MTGPPIRAAATVVLLRRGPDGPSVLMGRRGARAAFMPSKHVFPGGAVDPGDAAVRLDMPPALADALAERPGPAPAPPHAIAAAAIRELWEETGLRLARPGPWPDAPPDWTTFAGGLTATGRGANPARCLSNTGAGVDPKAAGTDRLDLGAARRSDLPPQQDRDLAAAGHPGTAASRNPGMAAGHRHDAAGDDLPDTAKSSGTAAEHRPGAAHAAEPAAPPGPGTAAEHRPGAATSRAPTYRPDASALRLVFRAVTPPGRPRRFDARFLMADAGAIAGDPDDFSAASDELSALEWVPLAEAPARDVPFVTEIALAEIARHAAGQPPDAVPFLDNGAEESLFHRLLGRPQGSAD